MNIELVKKIREIEIYTLPIGRVFSYLHTLVTCQEVEYENS